jgi:hypothetical protein
MTFSTVLMGKIKKEFYKPHVFGTERAFLNTLCKTKKLTPDQKVIIVRDFSTTFRSARVRFPGAPWSCLYSSIQKKIIDMLKVPRVITVIDCFERGSPIPKSIVHEKREPAGAEIPTYVSDRMPDNAGVGLIMKFSRPRRMAIREYIEYITNPTSTCWVDGKKYILEESSILRRYGSKIVRCGDSVEYVPVDEEGPRWREGEIGCIDYTLQQPPGSLVITVSNDGDVLLAHLLHKTMSDKRIWWLRKTRAKRVTKFELWDLENARSSIKRYMNNNGISNLPVETFCCIALLMKSDYVTLPSGIGETTVWRTCMRHRELCNRLVKYDEDVQMFNVNHNVVYQIMRHCCRSRSAFSSMNDRTYNVIWANLWWEINHFGVSCNPDSKFHKIPDTHTVSGRSVFGWSYDEHQGRLVRPDCIALTWDREGWVDFSLVAIPTVSIATISLPASSGRISPTCTGGLSPPRTVSHGRLSPTCTELHSPVDGPVVDLPPTRTTLESSPTHTERLSPPHAASHGRLSPTGESASIGGGSSFASVVTRLDETTIEAVSGVPTFGVARVAVDSSTDTATSMESIPSIEPPGSVSVVEPPGSCSSFESAVVESPGSVSVVEPPEIVSVVEPPGSSESAVVETSTGSGSVVGPALSEDAVISRAFVERVDVYKASARQYRDCMQKLKIAVVKHFVKPGRSVVFDLGCGPGKDINMWKILRPKHVIFMDKSPELTRRCERMCKSILEGTGIKWSVYTTDVFENFDTIRRVTPDPDIVYYGYSLHYGLWKPPGHVSSLMKRCVGRRAKLIAFVLDSSKLVPNKLVENRVFRVRMSSDRKMLEFELKDVMKIDREPAITLSNAQDLLGIPLSWRPSYRQVMDTPEYKRLSKEQRELLHLQAYCVGEWSLRPSARRPRKRRDTMSDHHALVSAKKFASL